MTFFYDLNKRLQQALDAPKSEHQQLNEGAKPAVAEDFGTTAAIAGGAALGSALGAVKGRYDDMKYRERGRAFGEPESDWDKPRTTMQRARAAVGFPSKNDPNVKTDEGLGDVAKKVGGAVKKVASKALDTLGHGSDEDLIRDLQKKAGVPQHGKKGMAQSNEGVDKQKFAALAPPKDKITFADKIAGAKKEVDEMLGDVAAEAMKAALGGGKKVVADEGSTGDYSAKKARAGKDIGKPGKNFAKIAKGAAERYGSEERGKKVAGAVLAKLRKKGGAEEEMDEGWDDMMKDVEKRHAKPKVGSVERGAKHDIEHTATGRKVTRRTDDQGISVGADDDSSADAPKRGRGRPKGTGGKMGAKGPSGKSKLMTKESDAEDRENFDFVIKGNFDEKGIKALEKALAAAKKKGEGSEQVDEKAVSKAQQRFMGMVHATQKGEKAPSKEVAKVAKSMGKKDAEDFAATKHKGLPEKKAKKKEKTEEAGGTGTPTASSGFGFGKGIYDSYNRELEDMIAESMARLDSTLKESMSVNMSNSTEGGKSLSITATEDDAMKLAMILKNAGLGGDHAGLEHDHGVVPDEGESDCGCGTSPCSCDDAGPEEVEVELGEVTDNQPDYPTNTEEGDALQYSGGINGPKSTGQTTTPVIASQTNRQHSYAEAEEDAIKRMMEMAGIKEAKKVEEDDVEEGNKFTGNLAKARAAGKKEADLDGDGDMEKVDESILAATRNLWKTYQPK